MGLIDDVAGGPAALDTSVFIYFIEQDPEFLPLVKPLFEAIDAGRLSAVTSAVTLLETLVVPLRQGDRALAQRYEALLVGSRGLTMLDLERPLLRSAALVRATSGVKTPDALQIAAALALRATVFITNDRDLKRVPDIRVLRLRDYLPKR